MITKKLAVPLINEKILQQAEHVYIATSAITDAGFDFIRSRIPAKCKMDMVTGLQDPTSPNVLKRIFRHYQGRITLNLFTRNVLHANVFIIDLPFRKSVAFVGSGTFSLEGLKDQEELFWKITDAKEIESLMSWFTTYFEFGTQLSESLIQDYEIIYPRLRQREIDSVNENRLLIAYHTINWDTIRFRNQFFKKEDYQLFSPAAFSAEKEENTEHELLKEKLSELKDKFLALPASVDFYTLTEGLIYKNTGEISLSLLFRKGKPEAIPPLFTFSAGINGVQFYIRLCIGPGTGFNSPRQKFQDLFMDDQKPKSYYATVSALGPGYSVSVAGIRKQVEQITQESAFLDFIKSDYALNFPILIEKVFSPSDAAISTESIATTVASEFKKLGTLVQDL